jgi:oligogalacturonide lyase
MTRREWMTLPGLSALAQSGAGDVYRDPVSGYEVREITAPPLTASTLYFHFSNFTADNRYVVFAAGEKAADQIFLYEPATGKTRQLTREPGIAAAAACPHRTDPALIYYGRGGAIVELNHSTGRSRVVGEVPKPYIGGFGQPTLSPDCRRLALARQRDARNWEVGLMDIATGAWRTVTTQGFRIGHVQHHPKLPLIFYVWETGGYAPQRTWVVNDDGSANRPFYYRTDPKEWFTTLKEWVTHEAWVEETGDMTLILDKTGVLIADPEGKARLIPGDYWHCQARRDGKWLLLDDNPGRLWLMEVATGNRILLASGLRDGVRSTHAHACWDRQGRYIFTNTGRRHTAVALIDLAQAPERIYRPI